jgi:hypothetical protein
MIQYLVVFLVAYTFYKVYAWTRCPDEIKQLPSLPFWSFFKYVFSSDSYPEKLKKDFQPMFNEYGLVRVRLAQ